MNQPLLTNDRKKVLAAMVRWAANCNGHKATFGQAELAVKLAQLTSTDVLPFEHAVFEAAWAAIDPGYEGIQARIESGRAGKPDMGVILPCGCYEECLCEGSN